MRLFWSTISALIVTYSGYLAFFRGVSEIVYGGLALLGLVCIVLAATTPKNDIVVTLFSKFDEALSDFGDSPESVIIALFVTFAVILLVVIGLIGISLFFFPKMTGVVLALTLLFFLIRFLFDRKIYEESGVHLE